MYVSLVDKLELHILANWFKESKLATHACIFETFIVSKKKNSNMKCPEVK